MESPQCYGDNNAASIPYNVCYPSEDDIFRQTKQTVEKYNVTYIFVATDETSLRDKLGKKFKPLEMIKITLNNNSKLKRRKMNTLKENLNNKKKNMML